MDVEGNLGMEGDQQEGASGYLNPHQKAHPGRFEGEARPVSLDLLNYMLIQPTDQENTTPREANNDRYLDMRFRLSDC